VLLVCDTGGSRVIGRLAVYRAVKEASVDVISTVSVRPSTSLYSWSMTISVYQNIDHHHRDLVLPTSTVLPG